MEGYARQAFRLVARHTACGWYHVLLVACIEGQYMQVESVWLWSFVPDRCWLTEPQILCQRSRGGSKLLAGDENDEQHGHYDHVYIKAKTCPRSACWRDIRSYRKIIRMSLDPNALFYVAATIKVVPEKLDEVGP
jgi:hypothetical protein